MPGHSSYTSCSPHIPPSPSAPISILPSFDELLLSVDARDQPLAESPALIYAAQPLPFVHPRKTPEIPLVSLTPPEMAESPGNIERPPPAPSAPTPPRGRPRKRASSAPAIYRRSTFGPASPLHTYKRFPDPPTPQSHTLGLSRMHPSPEHHGDRIKEIRDGDGAYAVNDAVLPEILPAGARPHFHGRHYSTTSLPPWISSYLHRRVQPIREREPSGASTSSSSSSYLPPKPIAIEFDTPFPSAPANPTRAPLDHAHSFGSHSPLSTCDPLTPRSVRASHVPLEPDLTESVEPKTGGMAVEEGGVGGLKIPTGPRMR